MLTNIYELAAGASAPAQKEAAVGGGSLGCRDVFPSIDLSQLETFDMIRIGAWTDVLTRGSRGFIHTQVLQL